MTEQQTGGSNRAARSGLFVLDRFRNGQNLLRSCWAKSIRRVRGLYWFEWLGVVSVGLVPLLFFGGQFIPDSSSSPPGVIPGRSLRLECCHLNFEVCTYFSVGGEVDLALLSLVFFTAQLQTKRIVSPT